MKSRVSEVEERKRFLNRTTTLSEMKMLLRNLKPPTDEFIAAIAKRYKQPYTIGKIGEERFYDDNGNPIYPPNDGVKGNFENVTLKRDFLVDRYGKIRGRFVSTYKFKFEQRSLPRTTDKSEYHVYKIIKPIDCVEKGIVAPWFNRRGLGIQYKFKNTIKELLEAGFMQEVTTNDYD